MDLCDTPKEIYSEDIAPWRTHWLLPVRSFWNHLYSGPVYLSLQGIVVCIAVSINIYSVEPLLLYYYLLLRQVYVVCISVPV